MPEPAGLQAGDRTHQHEARDIAPVPVQLWHVVEIHAIDTGDEGEWCKDCGDDRE